MITKDEPCGWFVIVHGNVSTIFFSSFFFHEAPGGTLVEHDDKTKVALCEFCLFSAEENIEAIKGVATVSQTSNHSFHSGWEAKDSQKSKLNDCTSQETNREKTRKEISRRFSRENSCSQVGTENPIHKVPPVGLEPGPLEVEGEERYHCINSTILTKRHKSLEQGRES